MTKMLSPASILVSLIRSGAVTALMLHISAEGKPNFRNMPNIERSLRDEPNSLKVS